MMSFDMICEEQFRYTGCSFVCFVCHKYYTKCQLKRCSRCKMVFYCSKLHQIQHWDLHKPFCKAVQSVMKERKTNVLHDEVDGTGARAISIALQVRAVFNASSERFLTHEEESLLFHPFVCNVCGVFKSGDEMVVCKRCSLVAYCSQQHRQDDKTAHADVCADYKLCTRYDNDCEKQFVLKVKLHELTDLPDSMKTLATDFIEMKTFPLGKDESGIWHLSSQLSPILTIIYVIVKSKLLDRAKSCLTLHIVSPQLVDCKSDWIWEYMFHFFPSLKKLTIFFVSPLHETLDRKFGVANPTLRCKACKQTRSLESFFLKDEYHIVKLFLPKADLIVNFNFPLSNPSNMQSNVANQLRLYYECLLGQRDAVVVVTSCAKKNGDEKLDIFKQLTRERDVKFLIENEMNPFKSLIPLPYMKSEFGDGAYHNKYITVFRT